MNIDEFRTMALQYALMIKERMPECEVTHDDTTVVAHWCGQDLTFRLEFYKPDSGKRFVRPRCSFESSAHTLGDPATVERVASGVAMMANIGATFNRTTESMSVEL